MGVKPIMINSALVSAQNRKRYYWTNIPIKELPKDRNIKLQDILENGYADRDKSLTLTAAYDRAVPYDYFVKKVRQLVFKVNVRELPDIIKKATGLKKHAEILRKLTPIECERLQTYPDDYTKYGIFDSQTKEISNRQRYKMLGNSFTVDVIAWILSFIKEEK